VKTVEEKRRYSQRTSKEKMLQIREQIATDSELGKVPDTKIAARYGVVKSLVWSIRTKAGIKPAPTAVTRKRRKCSTVESDEINEMMLRWR
jgi:hypothetical protein